MIKTLRREISILLTILYTTVVIYSIWISNQMSKYSLTEKVSQGYYSSHAIFMNISRADKMDYNLIKQNIPKDTVLYKHISDTFKGIYVKNAIDIPVEEGRSFIGSDFISKRGAVLIGKELLSQVIEENNKKSYKIWGNTYDVIGVTTIDTPSLLDYTIFMDLDSLIKASSINGTWVLDGTKKQERTFNKLVELSKENGFTIRSIDRSMIGINRVYRNTYINNILYLLLWLSLIICITVVTLYWIENKRQEIGILKLCGYRNNKILGIMIKKYILQMMPSLFVGIIGISIVAILSDVQLEADFIKDMLIIYFFSIATCLLIIFTFLRKSIIQILRS